MIKQLTIDYTLCTKRTFEYERKVQPLKHNNSCRKKSKVLDITLETK